jgi:RimJ/RimL family protein N-acetyltransferase
VRVEPGPTIVTERLVLRRWRREDREPFAVMNADPAVMEFFPSALSREQSDVLAQRGDELFDRFGYGLFAVEVRDNEPFVGFVGLAPFTTDEPSPLPFAPGVEVGWRLTQGVWGRGYAPEAATACLDLGFNAGLDEIVSFTSVLNERSQSVMRKIGMQRDPAADFDHPRIADGDRLRPHVLYRVRRSAV